MNNSKTNLIQNEKGSVLLSCVLVLMAVTILGVMSIQMGVIEMKICANENEIRKAFYLAESAAAEGVGRTAEADPIDLIDACPVWFHSKKQISEEKLNFRIPAHWDVDGHGQDNCIKGAIGEDTYIAASELRIASGASLVMTESRLHINVIYGLCKKYGTQNIIEIGYAMRY
ncbi:MAG: hypothetical protein GY874_01380 [Desulfobacteraceae bacterium]|nr:hypothetical protein [Desulfobacteraceae bacterium]